MLRLPPPPYLPHAPEALSQRHGDGHGLPLFLWLSLPLAPSLSLMAEAAMATPLRNTAASYPLAPTMHP